MISILVFICCTFLDAFLRVLKNILVNKSGKVLASTVNASLYLFNALVVKCIADQDITTTIILVTINSWIGCYVAMWVSERRDKKASRNKAEISQTTEN